MDDMKRKGRSKVAKRQLSPPLRESLCRDYQLGDTIAELAVQYDVGYATVQRILHEKALRKDN